MALSYHSLKRFRPSSSLILLSVLLLCLWLAGGASRADVAGQIIVRASAWGALIMAALLSRPRALAQNAAPWLLLGGAVVLVITQLIPLPPSLWQSFPERESFIQPGGVSLSIWRPWSIVPGATMNALGSLVVPATVLVLMAGLRQEEKRWLPTLLVILVGLSLLIGAFQFSGAGFDNPLINDTPGQVGGPFANRNHFALFLAIGCLVAPVWAFSDRSWVRWSAPVALGVGVLSLLTILATGSRAGLLLGGLALVLGLLLVKRDVQRNLRRRPRWVFPAIIAGLAVIIVTFLILSIVADRAVSLDRLMTIDAEQDMRTRGLPTVWTMIASYFPIGSGLGGFAQLFQIYEPDQLMKPTYFNHVHNDLIEVLLDTGIVGTIFLAIAIGWWFWGSVRAYLYGNQLSKLGSAIIFLLIAASLVDYPVRTPLIMAIATIATTWLSGRRISDVENRPALPGIAQHL